MEERKVKVGGKEKTEVADSKVKNFASKTVARLEALLSSLNKEAVEHCTSLVERIQLREERRGRAAEVRDQEVSEVLKPR